MSSAVLAGSESGARRDGVAEVTLLLPAEVLAGLESLARQRGLTVAQFLRRHITTVLRVAGTGPSPAPCRPPDQAGHGSTLRVVGTADPV